MTAAIRLLMMVSCVLGAGATQLHVQRANAQAAGEPVLALTVAPDIVPAASLQGALEAELGVGVELTDQPAPHVPLLTVMRVPSGNIEVSLQSRSVPRASRQLVLNAEIAQERVETIALIAANLVRNEAAALLPDLRPAAAPDEAAPPTNEPPKKPREPSPCDLKERGGFGFDLAPGVGTSSSPTGRRGPRRFSLGLIGTLSGPLHGFELSVGVNIHRGGVCGAQFAVGANVVTGSVSGAQFAQVNFARGTLHGGQFGLANLVTGRMDGGLQAGLLNGAGLGIDGGAQLGLGNYSGGASRSFQAGLINVATGTFDGAQLGLANYTGDDTRGLQLGLANVAIGSVRGTQLGLANVAVRDTAGLQFGIANVAPHAAGTQIGVVNYADSAKASIGMVSFVRRGRTSIDATGTIENGLYLIGVTHGGRVLHNLYGVGIRADKDGQRLAVQLGLGVRALSRGRVTLDIDAHVAHLLRKDNEERVNVITGLRAPLTINLVGGLGLMLAPSYQVQITQDPEERVKPVFGHSVLKKGPNPTDTRVIGYPGVTLGLRYQFHHGA